MAWFSLSGAPGVSTAALVAAAVAAERGDSLLVDADPSGGVCLGRCETLAPSPLLPDVLGVVRRRSMTGLVDSTQRLGAARVLVGSPDPAVQAATVESLAGPLAGLLAGWAGLVMVDCGRLYPGSPATTLMETVDRAVLVTPPEALELAVGFRAVAGRPDRMVLTVGSGRYRPAQVAAELGGQFAGWLPHDPATVGLVARGGSTMHRSLVRRPLVTAARAMLDRLGAPASTVGVAR